MYAEDAIGQGCVRWTSRSARSSTIPADGCIDLISRGEELWLAGPSTRPIITTADGSGTTVGLRFAPGLATSVLRIDPARHRDELVQLPDVVGSQVAGKVREALRSSSPRLLHALAADAASPVDAAWVQAVRRAASEQKDSDTIASSLGWSPRHLRRRMVAMFGYGYTTLVRIERAARARRLIARGEGLGEVAIRSGYADQSHMTRDFVQLVGRTPGQVAGKAA